MVAPTPRRFGRYEVSGLIGQGAFADVWRAWDGSLASYVAVKVLNASASAEPFLHERFVEEGQILRRVHSQQVVGVHDVGELGDGRPYLVVDLAEGGPLSDRLESFGDRPCDDESVRRTVESLAAGMRAMHHVGVIHRDIKPENLLIRRRAPLSPAIQGDQAGGGVPETLVRHGLLASAEDIVISDLGLAKDLERRGSAPSVIGGSAGYQAPEQLRLDGVVGPATDIYAASALLWRLVSGGNCPEPTHVADALAPFAPGWQDFFARALDPSPERRYPSATAWESAALDHLLREPTARAFDPAPSSPTVRCPYKGLAAFQAEDASSFFGRAELVAELTHRLHQQRVLVVAGPSGSGKSSLIRAGLLPALRDGAIVGSTEWTVELMTPGSAALDELAYHLSRWGSAEHLLHAAQLRDDPRHARRALDEGNDEIRRSGETVPNRLLCIDQFEELFTQSTSDGDVAAFVAALSAISDPVDSSLRVVIAVRADFYGRCAQIPWLAERITANQVLVGPMDRAGIREVIEEPARRSGLRIEPGLVDAILEESRDSSYSLPLISHALMETWTRRQGNMLTLQAFNEAGGVAGAVAQSADVLYDGALGPDEQRVAKRLMLRLVTPGEGTEDTRRKMPIVELERDIEPERLRAVVDAFVDARLLSIDRTSVEIAHEALIARWPRLRSWIDGERGHLRMQQRIGRAALEWETNDRDSALLYRGTPLNTAEEWVEEHLEMLDRLERRFLDESIAARDAEQARRAAAEAVAHRNRRLVTVGLAVLALASIVASMIAFVAFRRARANAEVAERQFTDALGTSALGQAVSDPSRAILLAVESIERAAEPSVDARSALVQARLQLASPGVVPLGDPISTPGSLKVALRPDGGVAAVADQTGPIRLFDTVSGEQLGDDLVGHSGGPRALDFTPDGRTLLSGGSDGTVRRWDLSDPTSVPASTALLDLGLTVWALDANPNGREVVVATDDGLLRLLDLESGREAATIVWNTGAGIVSVAYSPDGEQLVASNRDGRLQSWRTDDRQELWAPDMSPAGPNLWEIVFSADGDRFATAGDRDVAMVHDASTGEPISGLSLGEPGGDPDAITQIRGIAFSADGGQLIGGSLTGAVHTWNLADPTEPSTTRAKHTDAVENGAISADGSVYVSVGDDKQLRVWRLERIESSIDFGGFEGGAFGVAFDPLEERIAVGGGDGRVHFRALDEAGAAPEIDASVDAHEGTVFDVAWSPDGKHLASVGDDGRVVLWDEAGSLLEILGTHEGAARSVGFSPDGRLLVSTDRSDGDRSVRVWGVDERELVATLPGHIQGVRAAAFSRDGESLATADGRGEIRLWSVDGFDLVRQWSASRQVDPVWDLEFSRNGWVASVDSSEDLRVWDPESGQPVGRTVSGLGTNGATGAAFSGDGRTIVVLTRGGELLLVDADRGESLTASPIVAHAGGQAFGLSMSASGTVFATAGGDGVVRVWDLLSTGAACALVEARLSPESDRDVLGGSEPRGCV